MSRLESYFDALDMLRKAPRTEAELREVTGLCEKQVSAVCRAARDAGFLEPFGVLKTPEGERGRPGAMVWMWAGK